MNINEKSFYEILSQFYQKSTSSHPKKKELNQQLQNRFHAFVNNHSSVLSSNSMSKEEKKIKSPQSLKKSTLSTYSRASRAHSQKSSYSNDSKKSKNTVKIKTDEYFKCQWIHQYTSFVKSLMYAYLLITTQIKNIDLLIYLKEKFLEKYTNSFQKSQIHSIDFYWNKVIQISSNRPKNLQKQFLSAFQHFPIEFTNRLFELTIKISSQNNIDISKITKDLIKKISQSLGYGINYYHISKKFIRTQIKQGQTLPYSLNIVYIQEMQRFMISDRPLTKPTQLQSIDKIKKKIGENVSKLLKKYTSDTGLLKNLQSLLISDSGSRSNSKDKGSSKIHSKQKHSTKLNKQKQCQKVSASQNYGQQNHTTSANLQQLSRINSGRTLNSNNQKNPYVSNEDQMFRIKLSRSAKYQSLKAI